MNRSTLAWFRWLAMVPIALFATAVVQIGTQSLFRAALSEAFGRQVWTSWAAKSLAAAFMGAIFVAVLWWLAPRRKLVVGSAALAALVVWGLFLMATALAGDFFVGPAAMGLLGIVGGLTVFELARRSGAARAA